VKTYLTTSLKLLSAIREAVDADDPKAFVSAAHSLAASSTQLGARRLASLCEELVSLGQSGSCEGPHELVDGISEEFGSVQHELTTEYLGGEAASDVTDAEEDEVLAHVLVAEDDEVNQLVAVAVLESMGCRVDTVEDGQEALEQLEQSFFYDLVLMDCQMPTLDGLETTRALRRREAVAAYATGSAIRRLPIVALTGNADLGARKQCLAAGMDDYLTKPFTKDQLRVVIDKVKQGAYLAEATPESADADLPALTPIRAERKEPTAAIDPAPAPDTGGAVAPGGGALPQETASSQNIDAGERPRSEPRWQRLLRDPRAMLPWAIGGWVLLLLWVIVERLA
jgi:CheY-like chemotaxis protein